MSLVRAIALSVICIAMFGLSACNTVEGMGKDIQSAGERLEDAAK